MNRVNGMPIRVKCNYTIDDSRWIGEKIVQGQEIDIYGQDGLDWILAEHPDCVYEIEMTQEDWIELATRKAIECGKRIATLEESTGRSVDSYYRGVIPKYDNEKVDGHLYGGGLPDAYHKVKSLEQDVENFQRKSPQKAVVKGMPIRIVCTKKIQDDKLKNKQIEPGTVLNVDASDFEYFATNHSDSFQEIEMTQEDWIELATSEARECGKRIGILERASNERFQSHYTGVIPRFENQRVDGHGYGGGLPDAYNKIRMLQREIDSFEEKVYQGISNDAKDKDDDNVI